MFTGLGWWSSSAPHAMVQEPNPGLPVLRGGVNDARGLRDSGTDEVYPRTVE